MQVPRFSRSASRCRPLLALLCWLLAAGICPAALTLTATTSKVEFSNDLQRITFNKESGKWKITTAVKNGTAWTALFDARQPLIQGPLFNLEPTAYSVESNTASVKRVRFNGNAPGNAWTLHVEATSQSPLITFTITCNFISTQSLASPQPTVALWMNQTTATLWVNQGPPSSTGEVYGTPYNFGFPAAYLWDANREAMIYFDYTPMTWFRWTGMAGAADMQVRAGRASSRVGLGMFPWHLTGNMLNSGAMVTKFHLYSAWNPTQPPKFSVLDRLLQMFTFVHGTTATIPNDVVLGGGSPAYWETFTQRALADAMVEGQTKTTSATLWTDSPLQLVPPAAQMFLHATRIKNNAAEIREQWSLMTNSMHLAPWILYNNFAQNPDQVAAMRLKKDQLPRSYYPPFKMLVSGTEAPLRVFDKEIGWNNFYYYAMFPTICETLDTADFNPAIAGRMLMGMEGLITLGHNVNYVIPTYFDPNTKQPVPLAENPGLGTLREPYTIGQYAYALMKANEYTGEESYKTEAFAALDNFLRAMRYTESNNYFTRTFSQPMDMPVMCVLGPAYGAVAAYKLYEATGYPTLRDDARNILNVQLTMTYWREDNTDPVAATLHRQGLFFAGSSSRCATPWETAESQLCLGWMLKHDTSNPRTELMLRMQNLNRINSFNFYPATFTPAVRALNPNLPSPMGQYFPIEDFYGVENPGGSSGANFGGTAFYHFGNALWNWWMYEALCQPNDRSILTLNLSTLEGYREAQTSAQRDFIVYNPNATARSFVLFMRYLASPASGSYTVTLTDATGAAVPGYPATKTVAELTGGLAMPSLAPQAYWRLTLKHPDSVALLASLAEQRTARNKLSHAYQKLQVKARDLGTPSVGTLPGNFAAAWNSYKAGNYASAISQAQAILNAL